MESNAQSAGAAHYGNGEPSPSESTRRRGAAIFVPVLVAAICLVGALSLITNRMAARWDMKYYLDMATNGIAGNDHLATPFAYRPVVPLTIFAISHALNTPPQLALHVATHIVAVGLLVLAFYWVRWFGGSELAAWCGMLALGLNFVVVRYPLFTQTMIDVYAYTLVLVAFALLLRKRFYTVLVVCGLGLFLKEFLVAPLLTQAAVLLWETPRRRWLSLWRPLGLTALVIMFYVVFTRATIHVVESFDHINVQHPETLLFFITHPLSPKRWFNIIYSYLSFWLPCVLLMTPARWSLVRKHLAPYGPEMCFFAFFQLVLLMYGGNNIFLFVGYSLPLVLLVLAALVDRGAPRNWELVLIFLVLIVFNRVWEHIPTYDEGQWDAQNEFYGGFGIDIGRRSMLRFAEIWGYVAAFNLLRKISGRTAAPVNEVAATPLDPRRV